MLAPQIKPHFSLVASNNNNNTLKQQTRRQIVLIYKLFYEHFPTLRLGRRKIYAIISRKRFDQVSFSTRLLNNICCRCYCCCNWTCWRYFVVSCNCFTSRQHLLLSENGEEGEDFFRFHAIRLVPQTNWTWL